MKTKSKRNPFTLPNSGKENPLSNLRLSTDDFDSIKNSKAFKVAASVIAAIIIIKAAQILFGETSRMVVNMRKTADALVG